ncbi:MAG: hypothetical protein EA422_09115 [Gemmatimonadales bacterium]|nr:MAG: hypothetical protein EA422_09115 [Gemmatimonadales bacterium]
MVSIFVVLLLTGCGDLLAPEPVEVTAEESFPTLRYHTDLPTLPRILRWSSRGREFARLIESWEASWELPRSEGEPLRSEVRRAAAPLLASRLERQDLVAPIRELERTFRRIDELLGGEFPLHLAPTLAAARSHQEQAEAALADEDVERSILHLLGAADHLRATTPETLALELVTEAEETFRRVSGVVSYPEEERLRAERLLVGARTALDGGDPVLALQRAWYSLRLMDEASSP